MERQDKIDAMKEFLEESNISIIEVDFGKIVLEADFSLNKEENEYEYKELLEKGLTEKHIEEFKKFLESNNLILLEIDKISGVSFENLEWDIDNLEESELWSSECDEDEDED